MTASDPGLVRPPSQLRQLWLSRLRAFVREPGVIFWVFGFPLVMSVVLGLAFREKGPERFPVVLVEGDVASPGIGAALRASPLLAVTDAPAPSAEASLARAEALVLVRGGAPADVREALCPADSIVGAQTVAPERAAWEANGVGVVIDAAARIAGSEGQWAESFALRIGRRSCTGERRWHPELGSPEQRTADPEPGRDVSDQR